MNNRKSIKSRPSSRPDANKSISKSRNKPHSTDENQSPSSPSEEEVAHIRRPLPQTKSKSKMKQKDKQENPFEEKNNKRKRRFRPGQVALKQIKKLQRSTDTLISRKPFQRLLRDVATDTSGTEYRWTSSALEAMQQAAEDYMVGLFEDSYLCTLHAKRITLMSQDLYLAKRIRGLDDPGNR